MTAAIDRLSRSSVLRRVAPSMGTAALIVVAAAAAGAGVAVVSGLLAGFELYLVGAMVVAPAFVLVAIKRFDAVMLVAFALFGVVQFEPAPVDLFLAVMFPIGLLTGRLHLAQLGSSWRIHFLVWASLLLTIISLALSADVLHGVRYTMITVYCVSIMYFVKMYVLSENEMRPLVVGYIGGALMAVGLVLADLVGVVPDEVVLEQGRARGLFKDANVFGPFLIPAVVIAIDETWRPVFLKRWRTAIRVGLAAALSIGIFLSFSRAAWGNLLLTFGLYLVLNLRRLGPRRRRRVYGALILATVGLAVFVVTFNLASFLQSRASFVQSYDSTRFDAQRTGIELGLSNLFGIGPGMMDINGLFSPHSLYIRSLAEAGVFGFMIFVALIVVLFRSLPALADPERRVAGLSGTVIVAVAVGQMANGFLIDTLHWRHLWLIFGLVWLGHESPNRSSATKEVIYA